jgi:hypothetical protein
MRDRHSGGRIVSVLVVGLAVVAGGAGAKAQTACDPNYGMTAGGCVPGDRDYDCPELKAMGIGDIPVIGSDWQRLDGYFNYATGQWIAYPDGVGCEWGGE